MRLTDKFSNMAADDCKKAYEDLEHGTGGGTALRLAMKALKKEIPLKPYQTTVDKKYGACRCSNCKSIVGFEDLYDSVYCANCGTRIDWSE